MWFLALLIAVPATAQEPPPCKAKELFEKYKEQIGTVKPRITMLDGTSMENPFYAGERTGADLDMSKVPVTAVRSDQQIIAQAEEMRSMMLQDISRNPPMTDLQQAMYDRIKNTKVQVSDRCTAHGVNKAAMGELTMCRKSMSRLPAAALAAVLAHEFGHSVDVCAMNSRYLQKVDPNQNLSSLVRYPATDRTVDSREYESEKKFFEEASTRGVTNMISSQEARSDVFRGQIDDLIKRGVLKEVQKPFSLEEIATTSAYKCLSTQMRYPAPPTNQREACQAQTHGECTAQIWGARMLGKYIEKYPPPSPFEALGIFGSNSAETPGKVGDPTSFMSIWGGGKIKDFNAIYLSVPAVQNALGCKPDPQLQNCVRLFDPGAAGSGAGLDGQIPVAN